MGEVQRRDRDIIISLSYCMHFPNRTLSFLVKRSKNDFATPSNRWSGRKSEKF